ncbi:ATP-binding protein [Spongiactinospora sp. TRM90649]|uniref:ATP-binding protein n=1 Tax=Spongiactinospora sp. TRM90649 TaxID=3031114 RepID=UPI0023F99AE9|nr:ATP-binding protein [Spongiactinospora sp. TRM90649]MDF5759028.1 ATP-binding protein [Spongiactinospora sp. TRM90649]
MFLVQLVTKPRPPRDRSQEIRRHAVEPSIRPQDPHVLAQPLQPGAAAHQARSIVRQALRDAGTAITDIDDAELAVAELAANAEMHGRPPYELRIITVDGAPAWCEVVDGDRDLSALSKILNDADACDPLATWFQESGRGLLLVQQLSGGRCRAYPTTTADTGVPGKAVGFALPQPASGASELKEPIGTRVVPVFATVLAACRMGLRGRFTLPPLREKVR